MQLNEFGGTKLVLEDPVALNLSKITTITDQNFLDFISINYLSIFNKFDDTQSSSFQIDFTNFPIDFSMLQESKTKNLINKSNSNLNYSAPAKTDDDRKRRHLYLLISLLPHLSLLFKNVHLSAYTSLLAAEYILNKNIDNSNFVKAKQIIDKINLFKWDRDQNPNEKQSGVSNLGSVSESLLAKAFNTLIDNQNLFKTTAQQIQSYGDFVLMCLPNNLWISVKSNFARERLLASGYTTDILGVGFFTDSDEFTSYSKVRNFQRVGFLAMYLPDIPMSDEQIGKNTSTFHEVKDKFANDKRDFPKNINGTDFYRPLSQVSDDLKKMLAVTDIKKRTTIDF